jgi:YggT family protein
MIDLTFLVLGIYYFLRVLTWLIIARIILSWVAPGSHHPIVQFIHQTTEQILGPIRRMIPRGSGVLGMIDFSPLIAILLIDVLRSILIYYF